MTTGSARRLPWSPVALIPSAMPGRFSLSRRTLCRALAAVVALAALTPLFAGAAPGHARKAQHSLSIPQPVPPVH
jgi:hypothetical protein